jgi:DNA-binding CsgD family transcriptional regulator
MNLEKDFLEVESQIRVISDLLDSMLVSLGPSDLCRQIVHSSFAPEQTRGCQIFFLDNKSTLRPIASYGETIDHSEELTAWDDSPLSEAIREKRTVIQSPESKSADQEDSVLALPFVSNGVPTGLLSLITKSDLSTLKVHNEVAAIIGKLGAFYLETLDFGNVSTSTGPINLSTDDLTSRQITILGHIESGLVNLEIAKILMLSESTIRQETVRIYRALGVNNRQEAVKKAKSLGILPKRSIAVS